MLYFKKVINLDYVKTHLKETLRIEKIVTVHYFEYSKDFYFSGEAHDFWELIYVDRGNVDISRDGNWLSLSQGEIAFHKPNEFHHLKADNKVAPNLVIIAFECKSSAMDYFKESTFFLNQKEKDMLLAVIWEAQRAFSSDISNPLLKKLERKKDCSYPGCEQIIKINLEMLLISLLRKQNFSEIDFKSVQTRNSADEIVAAARSFLSANLSAPLKFEDVAKHLNISHTSLKTLFKSSTGMGVMEYLRNLRINEAKILIRETTMNFTQISDRLGYDSIHRFSRQFKKITGMSPTEYAATIGIK